MSNRQQSHDEKRKKQLEALFADEPFLSPTMKARRMHEKLQEMCSAEKASAPIAPDSSLPTDRLCWIEGQKETAMQRSEQNPEDEALVNFADATAFLRSPYAMLPSHRLYHFRMKVLTQWLRQAPLRETGLRER